MRTTVLEQLDCKRLIEYDENRHDILNREVEINHELVAMEKGKVTIRFRFKFRAVSREKKDVWGEITGQALTVVTDPSIQPSSDGKQAKMAGNIPLVIDGALAEDIFIPMSSVLRAMRLPPILVLPPMEARPEAPPAEKAKPALSEKAKPAPKN